MLMASVLRLAGFGHDRLDDLVLHFQYNPQGAPRAMAARAFMLVAAQAGCAARALAMAAATSRYWRTPAHQWAQRVTGLRNCRCRRPSLETIGS